MIMKYKKSMTALEWTIALILGAFVLGIVIMSSSKEKSFSDFFTQIAKKYTQPTIADNSYFSSEYIGIYDKDKPLDLGKDLPTGCTKKDNIIHCPERTAIEFYVGIKNTGTKPNSFYAMPRIAWDCKSDSDACKGEDWLEGQSPCRIPVAQVSTCRTTATYVFVNKNSYRIYPAAKCLGKDCYDPYKPQQEYYSYNSKQFIEIDISS
jgi:hypothetical protein